MNPPKLYSFRFEELSIPLEKAYLIMGYDQPEQIPEPVMQSFNQAMHLAEDLSDIKGGYSLSEDLIVDKQNGIIVSDGIHFETNRVVTHQLHGANMTAWFVCTAGKAISDKIKTLMQEGDSMTGYALDVIANITVDQAMDQIQDNIKVMAHNRDLNITNRYSPGYCDWDIKEQKKLFGLLPNQFCGIILSDSCLMEPIKSVSGIIGIGKSVSFNQYTCSLCSKTYCLYREDGK